MRVAGRTHLFIRGFCLYVCFRDFCLALSVLPACFASLQRPAPALFLCARFSWRVLRVVRFFMWERIVIDVPPTHAVEVVSVLSRVCVLVCVCACGCAALLLASLLLVVVICAVAATAAGVPRGRCGIRGPCDKCG